MLKAKSSEVACTVALLVLTWAGCAESQNGPVVGAISVNSESQPATAQSATLDDTKPTQPQSAAAPQSADLAQTAPAKSSEPTTGPQSRTAYFRADGAAPKIPTVAFTKREEALCKTNVGDTLPDISLPQIGGSGTAKLADLMGKTATVVVFWKGDRRMALEELADLGPDVIEPFGKEGVSVVGIAVDEAAESAQELLTKAGAKFPNLSDADGKAFAQVGSERLPRTYVLDASGKIVWFDIEYSLTTRRELGQTIRSLVKQK